MNIGMPTALIDTMRPAQPTARRKRSALCAAIAAGLALASASAGAITRDQAKRIHDRFEKEHGLRLRLGTGPEVMWLRKDAEGRPSGICSSPQAGGVDQLESLRPVVLRVIEYARRMGLDVTQCGHGDAPGQLRLELDHDDALRAADRLATYRQICAQVARELNLVACFMGKPFTDAPANGCDHIFALWKGGKDEIRSLGNDLKKLPGLDQSYMYRRGGDNAFMPDTDDVRLPGKMALSAIGGILQHLAGLLAIGCPTVNSYRGLADAMSRSSLRPGWSLQGRSTAVRVSAPGRIDYRGVDTMVNPYLMAAGLLRAMDDGIRSKLDAGAPEDRDATPAPENGRARGLRTTLGDSLAALASDDVVRSAMPGELYDLYDRGKREEWRRFLHTATDWDLRTYLGSLP